VVNLYASTNRIMLLKATVLELRGEAITCPLQCFLGQGIANLIAVR
jgi:hypothetical protein